MVVSRAALKRLAKLEQKKHREAQRLFLAEGERLIREATSQPVFETDEPEAVKRLSMLTTPPGPVAVFPFLDVDAQELLRECERVVLLAGVQDPGNVGAIIRSAHAFGAGVALPAGCADLYNPKTVRATMGSIFHVPVARELAPIGFLEEASFSGFSTVAAVPSGGKAPHSLPDSRVVLAVGAEGGGLPEEVRDACDLTVTIPVRAESLNAAMAASILLYEAYGRVLP